MKCGAIDLEAKFVKTQNFLTATRFSLVELLGVEHEFVVLRAILRQ